jgi:hypothetical protein
VLLAVGRIAAAAFYALEKCTSVVISVKLLLILVALLFRAVSHPAFIAAAVVRVG